MAFIKCPGCGKKMEGTVEHCPKCGCPITVQCNVQDKRPSFIIGLQPVRNARSILAVVCFLVRDIMQKMSIIILKITRYSIKMLMLAKMYITI